MKIQWFSKAQSDLMRLHDFLAVANPTAAVRNVKRIMAAIQQLPAMPRIGEALPQFAPNEVRKLLVGQYEVRYEIDHDTIFILRIRHTRENR